MSVDFEGYALEDSEKHSFSEYPTVDEYMDKNMAFKEGTFNNYDQIQKGWIADYYNYMVEEEKSGINIDESCRKYYRTKYHTPIYDEDKLKRPEWKSNSSYKIQRIEMKWNFHGTSALFKKSLIIHLLMNLNPDDEVVYSYTFKSSDNELFRSDVLRIVSETMTQLGLGECFREMLDSQGKKIGFFICININPDKITKKN
ncbi:hypothetical protein TVAG_462700 [Trichomonas vaginalis G3]|uniref:Uncharacterized protein n=1 Tax=Trichomonas vaginalis (strain ATCC PRA-98 / G3) TaxID=412133 RepID=A2DLY1_TRIV3|nr:hypothetical protein TVAGG3_1012580 [Trichomonas vaginalis G3]EAY18584.1 hypothetical protein TVAG_462700 [Trichomonas vaginalis G3]KAI5491612.1 hypothetical protein TVAGG3_1012580 [Trichomonas vaginalis G3]|eukprot:XP_001579570.1 hypothetical protein [Trichomonas vaginalis G3]